MNESPVSMIESIADVQLNNLCLASTNYSYNESRKVLSSQDVGIELIDWDKIVDELGFVEASVASYEILEDNNVVIEELVLIQDNEKTVMSASEKYESTDVNNNDSKPDIFRTILFWPTNVTGKNNKNKLKKDRLPATVTSDAWQKHTKLDQEKKKTS